MITEATPAVFSLTESDALAFDKYTLQEEFSSL